MVPFDLAVVPFDLAVWEAEWYVSWLLLGIVKQQPHFLSFRKVPLFGILKELEKDTFRHFFS